MEPKLIVVSDEQALSSKACHIVAETLTSSSRGRDLAADRQHSCRYVQRADRADEEGLDRPDHIFTCSVSMSISACPRTTQILLTSWLRRTYLSALPAFQPGTCTPCR